MFFGRENECVRGKPICFVWKNVVHGKQMVYKQNDMEENSM